MPAVARRRRSTRARPRVRGDGAPAPRAAAASAAAPPAVVSADDVVEITPRLRRRHRTRRRASEPPPPPPPTGGPALASRPVRRGGVSRARAGRTSRDVWRLAAALHSARARRRRRSHPGYSLVTHRRAFEAAHRRRAAHRAAPGAASDVRAATPRGTPSRGRCDGGPNLPGRRTRPRGSRSTSARRRATRAGRGRDRAVAEGREVQRRAGGAFIAVVAARSTTTAAEETRRRRKI